MFNAQNFRIEDRGNGWRVYADLPVEADHGREIRAFIGHDDRGGRVPFNPLNAQHCHMALLNCKQWVANHE